MPNYEYDKDKIKNEISDEGIFEFLSELGAEPQWQKGAIVNKTICHCGTTHKLYYYPNSKLFHCYTDCADSWDIFELVLKVKSRDNENFQLPQAIDYVARYFGYSPESVFEEESPIREDLTYMEKFDRIKDIKIDTQEVELKEYDGTILEHLPQPILTPWIKDGISQEVMKEYEIKYEPRDCKIIIPHRDISGKLVGIRERNLIQENIDRYGKYRPAYLSGTMYNHPLSFNLYGLYQNQENIRQIKKVFVFESEKSVLQYATMFGQENNIAVGVCGSAFINYQFWLLMNLGANEVIVGLDKQFQESGDKEFEKLTRNLKGIHKKYGGYATISILFDKWDLLGYKDSPTDRGKDVFMELYKRRVSLYNEV